MRRKLGVFIITLDDLSTPSLLLKDIEYYKNKLASLQASATRTTSTYHTDNNKSTTTNRTALAANIADTKKEIAKKQTEYKQNLLSIKRFIDNIDDDRLKKIIYYRFVKELTWKDIAEKLGGDISAQNVRMTLVRYMNKINKQ